MINGDYGSHPAENLTLNAFVWEASLATLGLQALALAGLYTRLHWGRAMATVACGFWVFTVIGLPFGIAGLFVLWRWQHPALRPPSARPRGAANRGPRELTA